jgi:hypothetical protein
VRERVGRGEWRRGEKRADRNEQTTTSTASVADWVKEWEEEVKEQTFASRQRPALLVLRSGWMKECEEMKGGEEWREQTSASWQRQALPELRTGEIEKIRGKRKEKWSEKNRDTLMEWAYRYLSELTMTSTASVAGWVSERVGGGKWRRGEKRADLSELTTTSTASVANRVSDKGKCVKEWERSSESRSQRPDNDMYCQCRRLSEWQRREKTRERDQQSRPQRADNDECCLCRRLSEGRKKVEKEWLR